MENAQADGQEQTDVGQPATDDRRRLGSLVDHVVTAGGTDLAHVADAEAEEPLGGVPVGGRQGAPGERVDPLAESGCLEHQRERILRIHGSDTRENGLTVRIGEVE